MSELTIERKAAEIELLLRLVVKNEKGEIIQDTGDKPSHSFVIQFLEWIYALLDGPATSTATDVDNATNIIYKGILQTDFQFGVDAPAGSSEWGLVVGQGAGAETNVNYKLTDQLTEGVGAGNITHDVTTIGTTAVVGANVDLVIQRTFVNNTGASLTVREVGIYMRYAETGPFTYYHCLIRDVLAVPITLADKCTVTVYYTLRTNVGT